MHCVFFVDLLKVTNKILEFLKKNFYLIFWAKVLPICTLRHIRAHGKRITKLIQGYKICLLS